MNCIATKYINIVVQFFFILAANFATVIILLKTYVSFKLWILTRLHKGLDSTSQCWTYKPLTSKSFIDVIGWHQNSRVTSMLLTDIGDEMCWWQFKDVGDGFGHFGHQHPLSLNINIGHQNPKDVTKILILSPTF